ncbi:MAG: TlpA family protein disulfide reductase [Verrucomicrobia bacterium]|nr:TlpA family protein disulfide reductase [Verrucomicrobiota bacterium]
MHKSYLIERIRWVAVVLSCLSLFQNLHSAGLSELRLKYRGDASEQTFSFDEHQGRIVVLDFFAYWCAPCLKASPLIEEGIAEYYSSKNGNPQGVPVDVIAVNVETSNSKRTDLFIRRTGLKKIIDDFDGLLLAEFEAESIPLIVVLDGTRPESGFSVVYQKSGFEGVPQLRSVIDSIGASPEDSENALESSLDERDAGVVSGSGLMEGKFQAAGEALMSDDFQLTQWDLTYGHAYGKTEWDVGFGLQAFALEMRSPDPFFTPGHKDAERVRAQFRISRELNDQLTLRGQMGYYDGFQSHRAFWLHEYYKQIGDLPFFGGYPDVDPRGFQLASQIRWEYLPASGYLEAGYGFFRDHIAPSAEFERVTVLGLDRIDSHMLRLATENVLNSRMRSLFELRLTDTTDRQVRWSAQGSLNTAITDQTVLRTQAGWTKENPTFDAWFAGITLEQDLGPSWMVSLFARYYHDTGEIQNSLTSSNAPPGLDTYHVGLGVRWVGEKSSLRLSAGPYWTRYENADVEAPFFEDLYQSRNWGLFQAAFDMKF